MKFKEKYDALSIQKRAVIRTVMFLFAFVAAIAVVVVIPKIVFPIVLFAALGYLCYSFYLLNLAVLESRERYKK